MKTNKVYKKSFENTILSMPDSSLDFAIDDPVYEIGHMNNKDYDDSKQLNWGLLSNQRHRTLKDNGNWGIWCGYGNAINILIDILYYGSGLISTEIFELMRTNTFQDIFNKHCDWKLRNWIIWDRQKGRGAKHNVVSTREDFIWLAKDKKSTFNKLETTIKKKTKGMGDKNGKAHRIVSNVWTDISPIAPTTQEYKITGGYKGQKPVALIDRCVQMLSNEGDVGHDGFCGSGTFAVSCIKNNRKYIVNDISDKAISITKKRIKENV